MPMVTPPHPPYAYVIVTLVGSSIADAAAVSQLKPEYAYIDEGYVGLSGTRIGTGGLNIMVNSS
jgi:hypothetical protein